MRLKSSGEGQHPILRYDECAFVDKWEIWHLYTECTNTTFDYRMRKYLKMRRNSNFYFNENYIRKIEIYPQKNEN